MSDRLPQPVRDFERSMVAERASAASARHMRIPRRDAPVQGSAWAAPRTLSEVEEWTVDAIVSSDGPANVEAVFSPGPRQTARERLEIHRFGYRARLVECLEDDYPVLSESLGRERFELLGAAYIDRHPSTSPSLNFFGRHMSGFCARWPEFGPTEDARFYSELAALEWAIVESIHAESPQPLDQGRLHALAPTAWATVRFVPSDTVRLLHFEFPVNAHYQARRAGKEPSVPSQGWSATAVYRQGLTVWRMDFTPAMARVLGALLSGAPLGDALARIGVDEADSAAVDEAERSVMTWFREWVSAGFFSDFSARP